MFGVRIQPDLPERGSRAADHLGLATALLELGLADLPGVVSQVGNTPLSPGVAGAPRTAQSWTLSLSTTPWAAALCQADSCVELQVSPPERPEDPTPAVASTLEAVAAELGRTPTDAVRESWTRRGTSDDYAALMAGRGAAVLYGFRDPPEVAGHRKSDPVERAFFLDPGMPIAGWVRSRAVDRGPPVVALRRASVARPESLLLQAELAASLEHPRVAYPVYNDLLRRAPMDRRFVTAIAQNRVETGRFEDAGALLNALGSGSGTDPAVARLRVQIADAAGDADNESLLQAWRRADPTDPAPVRRLVRRRVDAGRYAEAETLLPDLAARGDSTDELELALLFALGRLEEAEVLAGRTQPEIRALIAEGPSRVADPPAGIRLLP